MKAADSKMILCVLPFGNEAIDSKFDLFAQPNEYTQAGIGTKTKSNCILITSSKKYKN